MKKLVIIFLSLFTVLSCNKVSQSNLQGRWYVQHIILAPSQALLQKEGILIDELFPIFMRYEELVISKDGIKPCPTMDQRLSEYKDYNGLLNYTFSENKLSIPGFSFSQTSITPEGIAESKELVVKPVMFDIVKLDQDIELSTTVSYDTFDGGTHQEYVVISLHRMD